MTKNKIIKILYNIYAFLFIFTMINREFLLFGLDLRFILVPLGLILLVFSIFVKQEKPDYYDKYGKLLIIFYIYVFFTNISWLWNGIDINKTKFINEIILLINVFISILVFYRYKSYVKQNQLNIFIVISALLLIISMILVSCGFKLKDISGSPDVAYMYVQSEGAPGHKNIFGGGFRPAGYASDPNYATLLLVIACIATIKLNTKKIYKIPLLITFLIGIGLACSKTILAACILGILVTLAYKLIKPNKKIVKVFNITFVASIIIVNMFIGRIPNIKEYLPSTLTTRFFMWNSSEELFKKSPIIGNGITSFRSYFKMEKNWYVHCHSTYWQILSELGIIGILLYASILYKLLNNNDKNKLNYFMIFVYIIYAMTYETIAMQFIAYLLYIMHINNEEKKNGRKALFMINSLSNGGAERVCANLANELIKENYKVDFIILGENNLNNVSYKINDKINIYSLHINETNKIKKIFKIMLAISKVDKIISENEQKERYDLITSHLPMSNLITRLSLVRNRALYVFHLPVKGYDKFKIKYIYRLILKYMFQNRKVVAVSEGVRKEAIDDYGFKEENIKTIYNPINVDEIKKMIKEPIDIQEKYFLNVGRFESQKRQELMLDIFYQGEFYKKFKLVFCGQGPLEESVMIKAKKLKIEDKVLFMKWQPNIYKWMHNAEILVNTSEYESFSMTVLEALVCKSKVVSFDCDFGPREIMIGKYKEYLVEKDNIEEYIKKINKALKKYPTDENEFILKCLPDKIVKQYLDFMK